jgi:hypothetical protein
MTFIKRAGAAAICTLLLGLGLAVTGGPAAQAGGAGQVLVLSTTVSGGINSREAQYAQSLGLTVDLVDPAQWGALTAGDFGSYRAIILGDPNCSGNGLAAAEANAGTWGPQVDGEIIIIGTDPVFHYSTGQAQALIEQGIDFALSDPGRTGLFMTTSCYYDSVAPGTPIPALSGIDGGGFTAGPTDCDDEIHITATHPALVGLTDAGLSDWGCSSHNSFLSWPATFAPLAMAVFEGGGFVAPDGTRGEVYIIARGVEVFRALNLTPESATNPVGTSHTVDVTYALNEGPVADADITFTVTTGPHAGTTGTAVTNAAGQASFTYTGTTAGTDTIIATTLIGETEIESNVVSKTWVAPSGPTTTAAGPGRSPAVTPRFTG